MGRIFNRRETELLAPAGTFEDFEKLLPGGADAFYMGGKLFNMRMHVNKHNFTDGQLEEAVSLAHDKGKKVYITVNNLMSSGEIQQVKEYLEFLQKIGPDALIIQDFGLLKMIRDENLDLNLHLSVMANVHNTAMIRKAQASGVSRVVVSRELALGDIRRFIDEVPEMEYEYFIHGDMCSVHGSQCYYSGMLFGKSSNRGLCMKPCRWPYLCSGGAVGAGDQYLLAVKDICLYRHIPELLISGVNSFKIEGRMKSADYLTPIIDGYREAIDRYIYEPAAYYTDEAVSTRFYENRVRNLSTAYAFGKPGISNIDITGEREPKIFSRATEEFDITDQRVNQLKKILGTNAKEPGVKPLLSVKVNSLDALRKAYDNGADLLYLAGEVFRPDRPFSQKDISVAIDYAKGKKVFYVLPRMLYDRQFSEISNLLNVLKKAGAAGVVAGNVGEIDAFCGMLAENNLELRGDFSLNVYNETAASFYESIGLKSVTFSVEANANELKSALEKTDVPVELIVQGSFGVMYMEHCVTAASFGETSEDFCMNRCSEGPLELTDERGNIHKVYSDNYCKNHIISTKDICLLPVLDSLRDAGVDTFRIEAQHYSPEQAGKIVDIYRRSIDGNTLADWKELKGQIEAISLRKQSFQAFSL